MCVFFKSDTEEKDIGAQNEVIYVDPINEIIQSKGSLGDSWHLIPFPLLGRLAEPATGQQRGQESLQAGPAVVGGRWSVVGGRGGKVLRGKAW